MPHVDSSDLPIALGRVSEGVNGQLIEKYVPYGSCFCVKPW